MLGFRLFVVLEPAPVGWPVPVLQGHVLPAAMSAGHGLTPGMAKHTTKPS